ncbi:hypothetical protein EB796_024051 [Bugula neritina]|uniref:Uncharacterized protein n=1 Tax=Bugula neritina TaxID=10212 RepID=A0A7J7IUY3_BUGNE|nr:hypothetical protein EB796_024051 [Bugula neritina]
MVQSGISIMTKEIPDVGKMRIRYPVMPIHDFGNVMYKELSALSDMTLKKRTYEKLYPGVRADNGTIEEVFAFETRVSTATPPGIHIHSLELTLSEINQLKSGKFIHVETSVNSGHSHNLELRYLEKWNTSKYI